MPRYIFPANADRLVYGGASRRGSALVSAEGRRFTVHLSHEGPLADIFTPDGHSIAGSEIVTGEGSLLPLFYGPSRVERLWLREASGDIWTEIATPVGNPAPILLIDGGNAAATYTPPLDVDGGGA